MKLMRVVEPELLDELSGHDPVAQRSRRDLRRVNTVMGTRGIVVSGLRRLFPVAPTTPLRVLELGAGDGTLLVGVARALQHEWPSVHLTLLDQQALLAPQTLADYAALGWSAEPLIADVMGWAHEEHIGRRFDLVIANLFLHHFKPEQLGILMRAIAGRCDRFLACEPSRSALALAGSHLIGALGVNAVTRADAVASVHAGFSDRELTASWPAAAEEPGWRLREYPAGLFSHCLAGERSL